MHGTELWKTDGTAAGTKMVKNIRPYGKSSSPEYLTNVNGTLFFTANDGRHGIQLWKSDGTKTGTIMVTNSDAAARNSGCMIASGSFRGMYYPPVAVGSRLFYFTISGGCAVSTVLYVTDGTSAGTQLLEDAPVADIEDGIVAAAFGNKLYFVGYDGIWVSDGTDAGTHRMAGSPTDVSAFLPAHGQSLYFATYNADDSYADIQVWKTDGTKAGTKPLTSAGELRNTPTGAAHKAKRLYFDSGYWDSEKGRDYVQLWKTDGTAPGTNPILTTEGYQIRYLTTVGGRLFFTLNGHIWKSDGTTAGSKELGVFGTQFPRDLIAVGDKLCFAEMDWDAGTWSLWESNGTASGTYQAGTFAGAPDPLQQVAVSGRLLFAANDGSHGVELWSYTP